MRPEHRGQQETPENAFRSPRQGDPSALPARGWRGRKGRHRQGLRPEGRRAARPARDAARAARRKARWAAAAARASPNAAPCPRWASPTWSSATPTATSSCAWPRPARTRPLARLAPDRNEKAAGAPGLGDRLLVRFERAGGRRDRGAADQAARPERPPHPGRRAQGARARPGSSRWTAARRRACCIPEPEARDLNDGDLVLAQVGGRPTGAMAPSAARCWRWSAARTSRAPPR